MSATQDRGKPAAAPPPRRMPPRPSGGPERVATRPLAPIVPPGSIAGRALVAVLAIMCFLACLAVGAVALVVEAARDWQAEVMREVTIQVRPTEGVDIERELETAADLARALPGVASVRILSRAENVRLLEPWLGAGLSLDTLPVPRLVVVTVARGQAPDLTRLAADIATRVRGASLDDHRLWRERLAAMTRSVVAVGLSVLVLVLVATALSVVFATRGAMASNRDIVEVLSLVGAGNRFVAAVFQRRFMRLGFEGGAIGGAGAVVAFFAADILARRVSGVPGAAQLDHLVGGLVLGPSAYLGIAATVVIVAGITAITSRITVARYLAGRG